MFPVKFAEREQTGEENLVSTGTRNSSETTESNKSFGRNGERIPAGIMNVGEFKASLKTGSLLLVLLGCVVVSGDKPLAAFFAVVDFMRPTSKL